MKIEPTFADHWKTRRLHKACGPEAVLGLLRLWGQCQTRKQYTGLTLNPIKLAGIMAYEGDHDALWQAMTDPDAAWIDPEPEGTYAIHGYEKHNKQLIHLWEAGKRGGRPHTTTDKSIHTDDTYRNGLHMVSKCEPNGSSTLVQTPTLEEFKAAAAMLMVEEDIAEEIWHDNESRAIAPTGHWTGWNGQPIHNWRSNLKARAAAIARKRPAKALTKPKGVWEAKQGLEALKSKLERMKSDPRNRRHKPETPWETEWTDEARAEVARIRAKISELEGVVAA